MGEYTDQEIEMLARFAHEQSGDDVPWSNLRNERKADMRAYAREKVDERGMFSHIIRAAARLMREAREQGAAEMRERAALVALQPDICPVDGPVAAERIRALPLMPTTTNGNVNQGGDCAKCTVCGWTGRSPLPFESLPPKGACPSCGNMAVGIAVLQ